MGTTHTLRRASDEPTKRSKTSSHLVQLTASSRAAAAGGSGDLPRKTARASSTAARRATLRASLGNTARALASRSSSLVGGSIEHNDPRVERTVHV
jgi:hypothetical protein